MDFEAGDNADLVRRYTTPRMDTPREAESISEHAYFQSAPSESAAEHLRCQETPSEVGSVEDLDRQAQEQEIADSQVLTTLFSSADDSSEQSEVDVSTYTTSSFSDMDEETSLESDMDYKGSCTLVREDVPTKDDMECFMSQLHQKKTDIEAYDPLYWLQRAVAFHKLHYPELSVSAAYLARDLIEAGLCQVGRPLTREVYIATARRLSASHPVIIFEDLESLRIEAWNALIVGLMYCNAHYEGVAEVQKARKVWPGDQDLAELEETLKESLKQRMQIAQHLKCNDTERKSSSRNGSVFKRQYPWMEAKLFARNEKMVEAINDSFSRICGNCEIRPVTFHGSKLAAKFGDVGPLGVFAVCNIKKGDIILYDRSIMMVSNFVPGHKYSSRHCDACQNLLSNTKKAVHLPCCDDVFFCSDFCSQSASNYHAVLCGQNFTWLCNGTTGDHNNQTWFPLLLLRIFAIILGDIRSPHNRKGRRISHPLKHPLLAHLGAGYTNHTPASKPEIWTFFRHVVAPIRILTQLGVDVFADPAWAPEVIHTIYWRLANNSCVTTTTTHGFRDDGSGAAATIDVFGISPHYVFFNHSCDPAVGWTSTGKGRRFGGRAIEQVEDDHSDLGRGMVCQAIRAIKKGEEARISYVPAEELASGQLRKWFDGGCGCGSAACAAGMEEDSDSE